MGRHEVLTSPANPLLKDVRRAIARGGLTPQGWMVAETPHLLDEALRSGLEVNVVLLAEGSRGRVEVPQRGARISIVEDSVFRDLGDTQSSQGVIALVKPPEWSVRQTLNAQSLVVVLDGVQDPGNAGAIVRAAEAFGASGVWFLKGTANPANPKTLRASAGSLFRLPFVHGLEAAAARAAINDAGVFLYTAMPKGGTLLSGADLTRPCAIVIGGEGGGIGPIMRNGAVGLSIPTSGVESLNASVAAGILLYEARRQRTAS